MANYVFQHATMYVNFHVGVDDLGEPIIKRQTIKNVAQSASAADVQVFAQALASLYDGELLDVELVSNEVVA